MATAGATINETVNSDDWGASFASVITSFPENGTLDSVHVHASGYSTSAPYDASVAVYQNSTLDTAMTGATLVFDSAEVDSGVWTPLGSSNSAWRSIAAGGESLTGGQNLWIAIKGQFGYYIANVATGSEGDLDLRIQSHGEGDDETVAWSATAGTDIGTQATTLAIKAYVTYTATGGGIEVLRRRREE